jgi:hypothetical protein
MTAGSGGFDCRNTAGNPPGGSPVAAIVKNTAGFGRQFCFSHCRPIGGRCRHRAGRAGTLGVASVERPELGIAAPPPRPDVPF